MLCGLFHTVPNMCHFGLSSVDFLNFSVGAHLTLSDRMSDLVQHHGFPGTDAFLDL
jgi:hypothetical protein